MPKWRKDATEFVVGVNYMKDRGYQSSIPKPIMDKLGKPDSLKFVINDDKTIQLVSGKSISLRGSTKVNTNSR
jgi:hypothetical protein